ncbi:efflux RND transporter periplasmic adaptor subunit [Bartonella sp. HY329]|uniref:efflux RND transporter periplasmic adaptor subunit n=2 Tax=unclassified Bartonella TaxID=2645622 RepID=UPI0021C878A2|nr:efflux RND transporter periplasmic adaptor subunit [Bartonella sp. HY329]UXM95630.1 efflux RND transporter periplasmic adaptor subunit [Bartonella sp. HY329]
MNFLKKLTMGIAISATGLSLVACGQEQKAPQQMPPPNVSAVTIDKREVPITYEYAGRVAAYRETEVRARVGGILLRRNFIEGNEVKEGDVLFEIDPDTYDAEVARQKAAVAQAQATYDQSLRDAKRAEELLKQRVYSTAQRDQAFATRDANAASLQQAQALLKTAELNLQYTKVTAPISGVTSREQVPEGSLISANGLLTSITQSNPIYVNFSYTDSEAKAIQKLMADMNARGEKIDKLQVRITFGDGSEYPELGTIDFTSPTLDATTGTLGVRAVFNNDNRQLVAGQFVRVTVLGLKQDNAIVIPEASLLQDATNQYVYIIDENMKLQKRVVKVAREVEGRNWLLEPATKVMVDAPLAPATPAAEAEQKGQGQPKADKQAQAGETQPVTPKKIEETIGLVGGERVITDGIVGVQSAMGRKKPGSDAIGNLTTLDGKALPQPTQGQPAQEAEAKSSAPNDDKTPKTGEKQ